MNMKPSVQHHTASNLERPLCWTRLLARLYATLYCVFRHFIHIFITIRSVVIGSSRYIRYVWFGAILIWQLVVCCFFLRVYSFFVFISHLVAVAWRSQQFLLCSSVASCLMYTALVVVLATQNSTRAHFKFLLWRMKVHCLFEPKHYAQMFNNTNQADVCVFTIAVKNRKAKKWPRKRGNFQFHWRVTLSVFILMDITWAANMRLCWLWFCFSFDQNGMNQFRLLCASNFAVWLGFAETKPRITSLSHAKKNNDTHTHTWYESPKRKLKLFHPFDSVSFSSGFTLKIYGMLRTPVYSEYCAVSHVVSEWYIVTLNVTNWIVNVWRYYLTRRARQYQQK